MKLQLLEKGWDSSDVLYAMCLKWFWDKMHEVNMFWLGVCRKCPVWAEE